MKRVTIMMAWVISLAPVLSMAQDSGAFRDFGEPPEWQWAEQFGGSSADYGKDITTDAAGNIYVTGSFSGVISYASHSYCSIGTYDAFMAKWTASGNLLWFNHYPASASDKMLEALSIGRDNAGKLYITGYYTGTVTLGEYTLPDNSPVNFYWARLDASGNVELAGGNLGIATLNAGHCIRADIEGNVYILGSDLTYRTYLAHESTVLSLYDDGSLRWLNQDITSFYDMEISADKIFYSGTINGEGVIGPFFLDPAGESDAFIAESDLDGNYEWAQIPGHYSSTGISQGFGISIDEQGQVYQCGYFREDLIFDQIELYQGSATFVVKVSRYGSYLWANSTLNFKAYNICAGSTVTVISFLRSLVAFNSDSGDKLYEESIDQSPDQMRYSSYNDRIITTGDFNEFVFLSSYDESFNPQWLYHFSGDSGNGYFLGTDTDNGGNIYCFSYASNPLDYFGAQVGKGMFLTRQDPAGTVSWIKEFAGAEQAASIGRYLITDTVSGYLYIAGTFYEPFVIPGVITLIPGPSGSFYIIKYSLGCEYQWHIQEDAETTHPCLALDHSGNILISGTFRGDVVIGNQQLISSGGSDAFVAKYYSSGQFQWAKRGGGEAEEYMGLISTDAQDNVFFTGEFTSEAVTFANQSITLNEGDGNILLAKLNPAGQVLWLKSKAGSPILNEDNWAWPTSILTDSEGYSTVKGWHGDSAYFDNFLKTNPYSSRKNYNYFIAQFDPSGNTLWVNSIYESRMGFDYNMMDTDNSGNIYIGAQIRDTVWFEDDFVAHCEGYPDSRDLFIAKYSSDGILKWVRTIPTETAGAAANWISCLAVCDEDEIIMSGHFTYDIQLTPYSLNSDCRHGMIAFLAEPTEIGEVSGNTRGFFTAYPNPAQDHILLMFSSAAHGQLQIRLTDPSGRTVMDSVCPSDGSQIRLDISALPPGIYLVEATDADRKQAVKVIVE